MIKQLEYWGCLSRSTGASRELMIALEQRLEIKCPEAKQHIEQTTVQRGWFTGLVYGLRAIGDWRMQFFPIRDTLSPAKCSVLKECGPAWPVLLTFKRNQKSRTVYEALETETLYQSFYVLSKTHLWACCGSRPSVYELPWPVRLCHWSGSCLPANLTCPTKIES